MGAEQQKNGKWRIKKKDGTLGKRNFSSKSNALSAQRGGGAKGKPKPKGKGGGGGGSKAVATTKKPGPPKIGAAYSAGKATVFLIAPVTDEAIGGGTPERVLLASKDKVWSVPYAYNLGVIAADAVIDRKTAHATALTKGSVSAWAPEAFLGGVLVRGVRGIAGNREAARRLHRELVMTHQGYDPTANTIRTDRPTFRIYRGLRHGGQLLRRLKGRSGIVAKILRPLTNLTKMIGART